MKIAKSKSLLSNAAWNIVSVAVSAIAGFILVPIILREIGTENFGVYAIILMIGGFAQAQSLGLGEATLKYVSQYYARKDIEGVNRVLGATLSVYVFSGVLITGIIVGFASIIISWFNINPLHINNATIALRIAGISFLISIFGAALKTIPEATQRYDVLSKYNMVMMVIRYIAMYFIATGGGEIIGLTYLILFSAIVDIFTYGFLAKRLIPGIKISPNFDKAGIQEVFSFGVFSFINDLVQRASNYVDQLVLGLYFTASSVAYLNAPKDLISRGQGLTGAAAQALFPRFSSMDEDVEMQDLYVTSLWVLSMLSMVIFIPIAILIPSFLSIWLTPDFAENSADFARFFSLGVAFNGGVSAYFALLKGTGRMKLLTSIISTLTILSGISTAILVYNFGIVGSGIRMLLFSWVGSFLCLYVGKKVFNDFKTFRVAVETTILPVLMSIVFFVMSSLIIDKIKIDSWFELVVLYLILFIGIVVCQVGLNYLIYRKSGRFFIVLNRFKLRF
nr:oligosaccharide flippase family protein [uncultured Flavobacterium sp.]